MSTQLGPALLYVFVYADVSKDLQKGLVHREQMFVVKPCRSEILPVRSGFPFSAHSPDLRCLHVRNEFHEGVVQARQIPWPSQCECRNGFCNHGALDHMFLQVAAPTQ